MSEKITLEVSGDEALVLFELLSKNDLRDAYELQLDEAEVVALDGLLCLLEEQLVEPFQSNYGQLLTEAKSRLTSEQKPN